jgi:Histidine kinase-, DNA gyrase B-, and HSP90-like ATPase
VGETRVDLQQLLEDLRDAYTGPLEESIVTELVANALDAGASDVRLSADPTEATVAIVDDGHGMQRRQMARYHDVAASGKKRGEGIGFAGVGIKLGLLVSHDVLTETRRSTTHLASSWSLTSRYRAPWKWVPPPGLVSARGTAIRMRLANPLSPLLDAGFLAEVIRRHFEPLLDSAFETILKRHYSRPIRFQIDSEPLLPSKRAPRDVVPVSIRLARKRTPSAFGYLARSDMPLAETESGIAVSTFGKVIKRGWDWLGIAAPASNRVHGLVEIPDLAECLTLNKNDFVRSGTRGATYLAYRKALQDVVSRQLAAWGDSHAESAAPARSSRLDRDLARVLEDLASEFPLLHSLVERRKGGQKRLPMGDRDADEAMSPLYASTDAVETDEQPGTPNVDEARERPPASPSPPADQEASFPPHHEAAALPGAGARPRRANTG